MYAGRSSQNAMWLEFYVRRGECQQSNFIQNENDWGWMVGG